jgi:hypothetical protein
MHATTKDLSTTCLVANMHVLLDAQPRISMRHNSAATTSCRVPMQIGSTVHFAPRLPEDENRRGQGAPTDSGQALGGRGGARTAIRSAYSVLSHNRPIPKGQHRSTARRGPCGARPGWATKARCHGWRLDQSSGALTPRICFEVRGGPRKYLPAQPWADRSRLRILDPRREKAAR